MSSTLRTRVVVSDDKGTRMRFSDRNLVYRILSWAAPRETGRPLDRVLCSATLGVNPLCDGTSFQRKLICFNPLHRLQGRVTQSTYIVDCAGEQNIRLFYTA